MKKKKKKDQDQEGNSKTSLAVTGAEGSMQEWQEGEHRG